MSLFCKEVDRSKLRPTQRKSFGDSIHIFLVSWELSYQNSIKYFKLLKPIGTNIKRYKSLHNISNFHQNWIWQYLFFISCNRQVTVNTLRLQSQLPTLIGEFCYGWTNLFVFQHFSKKSVIRSGLFPATYFPFSWLPINQTQKDYVLHA
jgi:hypothetical protein